LLLLLLTVGSGTVLAQPFIEESLRQKITEARSDSERIISLGHLSAYYYANKDFEKGDSLIEKQIMLAGATLNQNLILLAFFSNAGYRSTGASTTNR
jgi:hypothetical protein